MYRGAAVSAKLLPKVRVDIVVSKISPRTVIEVAKKHSTPASTAMAKFSSPPWTMR